MPPPSARVLLVDDDLNLLSAFQRTFRRIFDFDTAPGGAEALELIRTKGPYAVVVADMRMPLMDGIELLERVRTLAPDTVRVMLTGNADQQTAVDAVNRGQIFRFLNKPCPHEILQEAIQSGLQCHDFRLRERQLLEETLGGAVHLMAEVLGAVAPEALGQGRRLRDSARVFCAYLGVADAWEVEIAAQLSGLGFAILPPYLIRKASSGAELTDEERSVLRRVPRVGHDLLVKVPRLQNVARAVLYQHQRHDGGGNPGDGTSGADLPLGSRILRILHDRLELEADGVAKQAAHDALRQRLGAYDPDLLKRCFECFPDYLVQSLSAGLPVHAVPAAALRPGQVAVSDIVSSSGIVFLSAGHVLSATMIARLAAHAELGQLREPLLVQEPAGG